MPEVLAVLSLSCVLWIAASFTWPLRLPEPDPWQTDAVEMRVAKREVKSFRVHEQTIKSKVMFAPQTPIVAKATGAVVIEELLKKLKLSGVSKVRGQLAAIISVKGKTGI